MSLWLKKLGSDVIGYSLDIPTKPSHFELLNLKITSISGDVRDKDNLTENIKKFKPDIIFHLAAQPLVRDSYLLPSETFETNISGTINIFEAVRANEGVKAVINVTSDKCYENKDWVWGYRESDSLGGYDPYSASKACSEIITGCYINSFFNTDKYLKAHQTLVCSVRAGNVIGGGDWAKYRLIPDLVRSFIAKEDAVIRNPFSTRPWQHVLDPLSGYLQLGQKLLEGEKNYSGAWNFGQVTYSCLKVEEILKIFKKYWNEIKYIIKKENIDLHEANLLNLDCSKAFNYLKWMPVWDINSCIENTVLWYKNFYLDNKIISNSQLDKYIEDAGNKDLGWII